MRFTTNGTQGTGTLRTSGGILEIQGASTTGNLFHNTNTANSLILGANTITVGSDYDNANFGVGNAFNRRANVSTTGTGARLLAGGDANQGLSGAGIVNGNTTSPSIVVGNVHVGATTYTYNINNTGTTGPALRGAIQNAVNGGNISDARLSGNGVLSSNWGPVAPGGSVSRDITFTVGAAGVYAPISGQAVSIVNNFENTRSQLLTITSAAGAAAYNLAAAAAVTPNPVNLGNQRVGGTAAGALTIANVAPGGSFSERLDAGFGTLTGSCAEQRRHRVVAGRRRIEQQRDDAAPGRFHRRREDRHGADQLGVQRQRHQRARYHQPRLADRDRERKPSSTRRWAARRRRRSRWPTSAWAARAASC